MRTPKKDTVGSIEVKILKPKVLNGSRQAKEPNNFLWGIEEYFKALKNLEEGRVGIIGIYQFWDAKL